MSTAMDVALTFLIILQCPASAFIYLAWVDLNKTADLKKARAATELDMRSH